MRPGSRTAMYFRMLYRAAMLRKGQAASALTAIIVATAASTAMLTLYVDVQAKLRKEFRNFGANIIVESNSPKGFTPDELLSIKTTVGDRGLVVPFSYAVARDQQEQAIVAVGTDFELARKLNPWWSVSNWPTLQGQALVGVRAARLLIADRGRFTISFEGRSIQLVPGGTLRTGAGEDSRVYLWLPEFEAWTGVGPTTVEIAASGTSEGVGGLLRRLQQSTGGRGADVGHVVGRQDREGHLQSGVRRDCHRWRDRARPRRDDPRPVSRRLQHARRANRGRGRDAAAWHCHGL